jgi:hypothetical protein
MSLFRDQTRSIRTLREPPGFVGDGLSEWYPGPGPGDRFWPAYREELRRRGWRDLEINDLDRASTRIVSLLSPPGAGLIRARGLVVGHVQSGKTANYTAVIAKAADAGYRLFVILSGMTDALRDQTQRRLESDLVALNPEHWIALTESYQDFRGNTNVNSFLSEHRAARVLGVLKKNGMRLHRLLQWLEDARPEVLRACPVLVIDDEADQASPNSHRNPEERTRINDLLVRILSHLPKAAYVGYTATPFANLLIDPAPPEDLYPRDFIIDLPRGTGYFGAEELFGRDPLDGENPDAASEGVDMIRIIPDDEVRLLQPGGRDQRFTFTPSLTLALEEALLYFWLATAARNARGQQNQHSTMLVHTSQYTVVHFNFRPVIDTFRQNIIRRLRAGEGELLRRLRSQWEREQAAVPPASVGIDRTTSFEDLAPFLLGVVEATEVRVENAWSTERTDYDMRPGESGRVYVVIGGNVLSRGLTLEGLTVSFFVRSASAYDTLLQMGRWFGYRPGYADLPRIWMPQDLQGFFHDLATVEREIRRDMERYKHGHVTPREFGVRIRAHPHLAITSRLKMQHAVLARMSFAGQSPQTIVFRHRDAGWLGGNTQAARMLVRRMLGSRISSRALGNRPHLVFQDVPADFILDFLRDYRIHERQLEMPTELLRSYISAQNALGRIQLWNVVVITRSDAPLGTLDLGLPEGVNLINRSRHKRVESPEYADIKALMSEMDVAVDVDMPNDQLRAVAVRGDGAGAELRARLQRLRDEHVGDRGLLLLYPVSKESSPTQQTQKERRPLEAVDHIVGVALVFPDTEETTPQGYYTVDLSRDRREVPEDEDELDAGL